MSNQHDPGLLALEAVPIGALVAVVVEADMALEHDLGLGRHLERQRPR